MTEKYDYKDAIDRLRFADEEGLRLIYGIQIDTIRHALKLAEKVTGEPSDSMWESGYSAGDGDTAAKAIFKAMIAQAQKEIEPPQAGEEG